MATNRLLPLAVACIIGALTLFSGPTGIASIGALLVAIGPLRTILHRRSARFGYLALLAPIAAACTVTVILIFRDQTLVGEIEANALKSAVGPSLSWFDEHIRYERLFMATPDGSVARRFAVLALLVALAVVIAMALRKGRIPGTAAGPSRRIIGITVISFLAMMFTPDQVDAPLRRVRRTGRLARCTGRRGGDGGGDEVAAQPRGVRRAGAVHDRAVVRERQRLLVRVEFRCAVVEFVPRVPFRLHHHAAGIHRAGAVAGRVVPLLGARPRTTAAPTAALAPNCAVPVGDC